MRFANLIFVVLGATLLVSGCSKEDVAGGGKPTILGISPSTVSIGENVVAHINGNNFGGVTSVTIGNGVQVTQFSASSSSDLEVHLAVDGDASPGARNITVQTANGSTTAASLLKVGSNHAPNAKFTVFPDFGATNTQFLLDANRSYDLDNKIVDVHWDFGDNRSASGFTVLHQYENVGIYTITLTVTDKHGTSSQASKDVEVIEGVAPTAHFTVSPDSGDEDTLYTFNAADTTAAHHINDYAWDFGDGKHDEGKIVQHVFHHGGTFGVQLIVTDNKGFVGLEKKDLVVKNFDEAAAIQQIRSLLIRFFVRYSQLETLSAEYITEGWSDNCSGRQHEIDIVNGEKDDLIETNADVTGTIPVTISGNHKNANAEVTAVFEWTNIDSSHHKARCTHHFSMIFEDGQWKVCDFTVDPCIKILEGIQ